MAAKSLKLSNFHVGPQDTLTITFLQSGTFCSPDVGDFNPPLPDGVFFQKGQTWPDSGGATPTVQNAKTRYTFHESDNPPIQSPCEQGAGAGPTGASPTVSGDTVSGFNVIHIP
jgi:hypothetical protein